MSVAIAFDFLPQLGREMERLKIAAASRGAIYDEGNPLQRAGAMISLLIPLFRSTLRHAGNLADAMDMRGYNAGQKRTRIEPLKYTRNDRIAAILLIAVYGGLIGFCFYLGIHDRSWIAVAIGVLILFVTVPAIIRYFKKNKKQ